MSNAFPFAGHATVLTPPGPAAIAVIRLSGMGTGDFLKRYFPRPTAIGRAVHGDLAVAERVIDDVVVARLDENTADLSLHGNATILRSVLALAERSRFQISDEGAAAPLDVLDGESDIEREVAAAIPQARTALAWRILLGQPVAWAGFESAGSSARSLAKKRMLEDRSLQWLLSPPKVALVGLPNAGKSTLANALAGQDRHLTADLPGTTRDWVGTPVDVSGLTIELLDTPGIRKTTDPLEAKAIELSQSQIAEADLILLVLDATRRGDVEQDDLRRRFPNAMAVSNKCDLAGAFVDTLPISAAKRSGLESVRSAVLRKFDCGEIDSSLARIWTPRQREQVDRW